MSLASYQLLHSAIWNLNQNVNLKASIRFQKRVQRYGLFMNYANIFPIILYFPVKRLISLHIFI